MTLSKQTLYAAMGERPPEPTSPAKLPRGIRYRKRQDQTTEGGEDQNSEGQNTEGQNTEGESKITEVCAYYSFDGSDGTDEGWVEMQCEGGCTTSGSIFGCREDLAKTCNECDIRNTAGASCCASDYPRCVTAVMEDGNDELTAWRCAATFSGRQTLFPDTTERTTEITTEDGETRTITNTNTDTAKSITNSEGDQGAQPTAIDDNNNGGGGGDGGSDTPVGAIVGGVIGGVALILLIAFGIWFIRFQKRKAAAKHDAAMEPYRQDPSQTGYAGAGYGNPAYAPSMATSPPSQSIGAYGPQDPHNPAMYGYYGHSPKPEDMQAQQVPIAEMPQYGSNDPTQASELPAGPQR